MAKADSRAEYRSIPGFTGYRVGSDGTVWSCWAKGTKRTRMCDWFMLRPGETDAGYHTVAIIADGKKIKSYHVHRLVLLAFVGPKPAGMHTRHLNGDPGDDRLENLRYGTPSENQMDRVPHGRSNRGTRYGMSKLTDDAVREIRHRGEKGERHSAIAKDFGVSQRTVTDVCTRKRWGHLI